MNTHDNKRLDELLATVGLAEALDKALDSQRPANPRRPLRHFWPLAAALLLGLILLRIQSPAPLDQDQQLVQTDLVSDPVALAHIPGASKEERVDLFEIESAGNSEVLVLVNRWDAACDCLRVPQAIIHRADVVAGEPIYVELDVTGDPPVEQHLLVVSIPSSEDAQAQVDNLLACLEEQPQQLCSSDEDAAPDALAGCLPPGLALSTIPFVVH